jgi:hypothetical protein
MAWYWYALIGAFGFGALVVLAARCGLPHDQDPYFTEDKEPIGWGGR